jgi:hypothetical protein
MPQRAMSSSAVGCRTRGTHWRLGGEKSICIALETSITGETQMHHPMPWRSVDRPDGAHVTLVPSERCRTPQSANPMKYDASRPRCV